jgi:hypothetical protein
MLILEGVDMDKRDAARKKAHKEKVKEQVVKRKERDAAKAAKSAT